MQIFDMQSMHHPTSSIEQELIFAFQLANDDIFTISNGMLFTKHMFSINAYMFHSMCVYVYANNLHDTYIHTYIHTVQFTI